jgi:hypothetical protein
MKDKIYNFFNRGDIAFTLIVVLTVLFFKWAFWLAAVHGK